MMKTKFLLTAFAAFTLCSISPSVLMAAQASPAQAYEKLFTGQEAELVAAAEAMPADKYNFAPTNGTFDGVRTFAQQITHIASAQYFFFGGFGIKPDVDPKAINKLTNKDEVIKALKDSFAFAHQAIETMTAQNAFDEIAEVDDANTRATIAAVGLAHTNDHYGQIVEYLRMNGIIPPASRK